MITPSMYLETLAWVVLGVGVYLLPWVVAAARRHPASAPILALDLLLGWTFLGWVGALVWALLPVNAEPARR